MGISHVRGHDRSEFFLTSSIPKLQFILFILNLAALGVEVDSDSRLKNKDRSYLVHSVDGKVIESRNNA